MAARRHPGQPPWPGASGQRQEHRLRLVLQRVPEQDDRPGFPGRRDERLVPRLPGGRLRTARPAGSVHSGHRRRVQADLLAPGRYLDRPDVRAGLQPVVDGDQSGG